MYNKRFTTKPKDRNQEIEKNLSVILLSAGSHRNFKRSICTIELSDGETIIQKQIKTIKKVYPNSDITVVIGHDCKYTLKYFAQYVNNIRIIINEQFLNSNNSKSLYLALLSGHKSNVLVINGDILFDEEYIKNCIGSKPSLTIDDTKQITKDEVGVIINNNIIENISHGLNDIWSQIFFMREKEIFECKEILSIETNWNKYIHEIINDIIDSGSKFIANRQKTGYIKEIDNFKDLEKVNEILI